MVATTTTHGLPYPTAPDRPCDTWETWCSLAGAIDANLTGLNADLNRTARAAPMAKISGQVAYTFPIGAGDYLPYPMDAVEVDTDGMVDVVNAPGVIVPQLPGLYQLEGLLVFDPTTLYADLDVWIVSGSSSVAAGHHQVDFTWSLYDNVAIIWGMVRVITAGASRYSLTATATGTASTFPTAVRGELSAIWRNDL